MKWMRNIRGSSIKFPFPMQWTLLHLSWYSGVSARLARAHCKRSISIIFPIPIPSLSLFSTLKWLRWGFGFTLQGKRNRTREADQPYFYIQVVHFIISSLKQEEHKEEHQKRRSRLTRNRICISVGTSSRTGHLFDYALSVRSSSASLSHSLVAVYERTTDRRGVQVREQWKRRRRWDVAETDNLLGLPLEHVLQVFCWTVWFE